MLRCNVMPGKNCLHLLPTSSVLILADVVKGNFPDQLVRNKREWIIPPTKLTENEDYTTQSYIAKIRSDNQFRIGDVQYSLHGVGADKYPYNVFFVVPETGFVRITRTLDREYIHQYNLSGMATFKNGTEAEHGIELRIVVLDVNDNPPVFPETQEGSVYELSQAGTFVMKIEATDADEPNNINSKIAFKIIEQTPQGDMFYIDDQGQLLVKRTTLDREALDTYTLKVLGKDLNGREGGHEATGTVTIRIKDVNDNVPTLEKEEYSGSIQENTKGVEVMRIKAQDLDIENTENWEAVFDIVKGNEAGYFSITTDPKTNEGILMLDKAVDYEDVKDIQLGLSVRNKAEMFSSGGGSSRYKSYPIKINVLNVPEGPRFDPQVKAIPISEGGSTFNINDVLGKYPAIDGDTGKDAQNVRYVKGLDPGNWLTIDPVTSEIRLNKMPDRESTYLVNGTYYAKILCITEDMPSVTATGTIAIQVEDFNDHCPTLTSNVETMCTTANAFTVSAVDEDAFPNSAPFHFFILPEGTQGKWDVEHLNETSAILRSHETLWPGYYEVNVEVHDQQGEACPEPQKVKVEVCTCEDGKTCGLQGATGRVSKGSVLGPAAIGLMLLGFLMLLLMALLLMFCHCGGPGAFPGGFAEMPFDTKPNLMTYHTEGQGENTEVPLLNMPPHYDMSKTVGNQQLITGHMIGGKFQQSTSSIGGVVHQESVAGGYGNGTWRRAQEGNGYRSEIDGRETAAAEKFSGLALSESYLGNYYTQKASFAPESQAVKDSLLVYDYEGQGSPVGSIGCCSLLEVDNDLQFLDNLGPKFKTLAEVCGGKEENIEVKPQPPPQPQPKPQPQPQPQPQPKPQPQPQPQPQPLPPPQPQTITQNTERRVVGNSSHKSKTVLEGVTSVGGGMAGQGQTLVMQQQPVYYTTAPVMQPMHYIMQPQMQNTMYLANSPATTNMQGMMLVNGGQLGATQGMMMQSQSAGQGGGAVIHTGNLPQGMMVVEGQVPAGSQQMLQGQTYLVQGGTLKHGLSASQSRLVVERQNMTPVGQGIHIEGGGGVIHTGSLAQGMMVVEGHGGSQQMLHGHGQTYSGSKRVTTSTTSNTITPIKSVVHKKRVVTTEKITH
ncbi:unnamed protein product [Lota lota]